MIHTYSALPVLLRGERRFLAIGVDPAISQKDAADCTAMVTLDIRGTGNNLKFYVLPSPLNGHPGFPETMDLIKELNVVNRGPRFYVESVAYQTAIVQSALREAIDVKDVNLQMDKRTRLNMISNHIRNGQVLFPESGCELLITELIGFGVERYDDLVDALTIAIIGYLRELQNKNNDSVRVVGRIVRPRITGSSDGGWTRLCG
jgi:predicted phage terminase large subunit-like protein